MVKPERMNNRGHTDTDSKDYLGTLEGSKTRAEIFQSEDLLEILGYKKRTTREIIYASIHCLNCNHFERYHGSYMRCLKNKMRLVRPFYGRAIWTEVKKENGEKERIVADIDWDTKWLEVEEDRVLLAMKRANNGLPYECYETKGSSD